MGSHIVVQNILDLYELEKLIGRLMGTYDLDDLLAGLRCAPDDVRPFMIAGAAKFALRFANPPLVLKSKLIPVPWEHLRSIVDLVNVYLLSDPSGFDPPAQDSYHGSTLIPVMLRIAGNQFPYEDDFFGHYGRSLKLFRDIPRTLKTRNAFDVESKFFTLNGVSLTQFIDIGFVLYAAALSNIGFVGDYFEKARRQGVNLPADSSIGPIIEQFSADIIEMREIFEKYKQPDRRYAAYDFNPFWVHPLIRPWTTSATPEWPTYRFIAPLPQMVVSRMSGGIYSQLFHRYKDDFAKYFGALFEHYVGDILLASFEADKILSETDIRRTYHSTRGKAPDWVVFEGDCASLVECKATGLSGKALATGDMKAIDFSIEQIIKGLVQLHEFRHACGARRTGLERFYPCSTVNLFLVTYERFYIVNSEPFREFINTRLAMILEPRGIKLSDWYVFSIGELEKLQPHMAASIELKGIGNDLRANPFSSVLERCYSVTGKTYRDSFLYEMDEEIYTRLSIPS